MLPYQIEFTSWADNRMLDSAAKLTPEELTHDFKTSEKSILGTLVHIYRAERIWLSRLHGRLQEFRTEGDDTLPALQTNWPRLNQQWLEYASTLSSEQSHAELTYHDLRNNPWIHPVWKIILQVVNHSTHHRGQVSGFIRALGHMPPNVDFITFARGL